MCTVEKFCGLRLVTRTTPHLPPFTLTNKLRISNLLGIKFYPHCLCVAGIPTTYVAIGWVGHIATREPDCSLQNSLFSIMLDEDVFSSPETARCKGGYFDWTIRIFVLASMLLSSRRTSNTPLSEEAIES
jgi:hypothetical protein